MKFRSDIALLIAGSILVFILIKHLHSLYAVSGDNKVRSMIRASPSLSIHPLINKLAGTSWRDRSGNRGKFALTGLNYNKLGLAILTTRRDVIGPLNVTIINDRSFMIDFGGYNYTGTLDITEQIIEWNNGSLWLRYR
jgi:hypothetical protein